MSSLPLIAHQTPDAVVAWRDGIGVSAVQFLIDVDRVARLLPPGRHALNLCRDRYHFTVSLAACIVSGRVSLLPSTHTPEMVRQMQRIAPDVFCITDQAEEVDLPVFELPALAEVLADGSAGELVIPEIPCDQVVAQVFTSGSTGVPEPHVKRWGNLVRSARSEAQCLGITGSHAILGTVPAQHMYGLESTVLMPLQSGAALDSRRPFYPADICSALEALPHPRVLVTTPYHLRALLVEQDQPPSADLLLSATAPLSHGLAVYAEAHFAAVLHEIYGCTETGQVASRRPVASAVWETLPGVHLRQEGESVWAEGGHIETPTPLADRIQLVNTDPIRFLLHGRNADLVNIAGKRSSLAYLNHQLNAVTGVRDGVFLPPPDDEGSPERVRRLTALAVAPGLTPAAILQALRERIDPVFLPRPLLLVDALPRNATGKLPSHATAELFARLQTQTGPGLAA